MPRHPSDSTPQQRAEPVIVHEAGRKLGCTLRKERIAMKEGPPLEVDGYSESARVLCEAFAHLGKPQGGQLQKPLADALKLLLAERLLGGKWSKVLAFADEEAARSFTKGSWRGRALEAVGVRVVVVSLSRADRVRLRKAQKRQRMTNVPK